MRCEAHHAPGVLRHKCGAVLCARCAVKATECPGCGRAVPRPAATESTKRKKRKRTTDAKGGSAPKVAPPPRVREGEAEADAAVADDPPKLRKRDEGEASRDFSRL